MKWWHWVLAAVAILILIAEKVIATKLNLPGQFVYILGLELTYFFVLFVLGTVIGDVMRKRLQAREDREEYAKSVVKYRLLAGAFAVAAGLYMMTAWVPGWIGRNIIFFAGYYYGLSRNKDA